MELSGTQRTGAYGRLRVRGADGKVRELGTIALLLPGYRSRGPSTVPQLRVLIIFFLALLTAPGTLPRATAQHAVDATLRPGDHLDAALRSNDPVDATLRLARPAPSEERWRLIPWHTSLTAALREAARIERPVFYFGYDGVLDVGNC